MLASAMLAKVAVGAEAGNAVSTIKYAAPTADEQKVTAIIAAEVGRIEAKLVDAVAKDALRVKEILVDEGDLVKPGDVLVRLDTATFDSQLAEAKLRVATSQQRVESSNFAVVKQKSLLENAKLELERDRKLVEVNAIAQRDFDTRKTQWETATAALSEEEATIEEVNEPYLMQTGLIERTPRGRTVTKKGYAHIGVDIPRGQAPLL